MITQKECYDKYFYDMDDCPGCPFLIDCRERRFDEKQHVVKP